MLTINNAHLNYEGVRALKGVDLSIPPAAITTLIGSNGAGKSSLLKAIMGLNGLSSGEISLEGHRIDGLSCREIVKRGIALVPEGRELFPRMSVLENLLTGACHIKNRSLRKNNLDRVLALFPVLSKKLTFKAHTLSGGEQQMLAFGRALMSSPKFLLLDEPSIGLAPLIEQHIISAVVSIVEETKMGVLLIEQNALLALECANYAYVMDLGEISYHGLPEKLLSDPKIITSYLGG